MAIVETVPAQVEVGQTFSFSGTGYTSAGLLKISAYSEDGNGGISLDELDYQLATGVTILANNAIRIAAQEEGHVVITITDVTAVLTNTHRVPVFRASGV
jgi:hypothetical protein